ncbi:MAG TPA: methyltransferase domain-containing protein [Candidatus Polarisedimenticolia bacterium]|nr:methyltransferase domain-containing protein [Candidatus Polarisedimenticolia bacterium]
MTDERQDQIVRRFTAEAPAFRDSPAQRDAARLARLIAFAAPQPGERAVDLASGPGIVSAALAARGALVVAVDLTPAMLKLIDAPGVARARATAERLPFPSGAFDLAVARSAFHHFDRPMAMAREAARVLRHGGRLIIEDMIAAEDLRERDTQEVIERLRDPVHARTLPPSEFRALLAAAGFDLEAEAPAPLTIDFDEWVDRTVPDAASRARARYLMETRIGATSGVRAWIENDRLRIERPGLLFRAVRR